MKISDARVYGLVKRVHPVRTGEGRWAVVAHEWRLSWGLRSCRVSPRFAVSPDFLGAVSERGV